MRNSKRMEHRRKLALLLGGLTVIAVPQAARAGTLYLGSESQLTALAIFTTSGPSVTTQTVVPTSGYAFNGVGEGAGLTGIVTGALDSGNFNTRTLAGSLTGSSTHTTPGYLNEDFAGNGTQLWRANSASTTLYKLDPASGATMETHNLTGASELVGLTFVGSQLWAGDFGAGTVGTVDTTLDTYTPVFAAFGSGSLGGLAYDPTDNVLWIGSFSVIRPYNTAGAVLGPDVSTSAAFPGFIDGLAFIPTAAVPEPNTLLLAAAMGLSGLIARLRRRVGNSPPRR